MKSRISAIFVLAMLLGFQNCSKVKFSSTNDGLVNKAGDGLDDGDFPENEELDPDLVEEVVEGDCELFAASTSNGITDANVKIHKYRGDLVISDSHTLDLTNIRGSIFAKTDDALHLRNIRGGLCLVGSTLDKLNNHRGNIEIIGANTNSIINTRGTLTINGGYVDSINGHRGNIVFKNGATVGEIKNHKDGTVSGL